MKQFNVFEGKLSFSLSLPPPFFDADLKLLCRRLDEFRQELERYVPAAGAVATAADEEALHRITRAAFTTTFKEPQTYQNSRHLLKDFVALYSQLRGMSHETLMLGGKHVVDVLHALVLRTMNTAFLQNVVLLLTYTVFKFAKGLYTGQNAYAGLGDSSSPNTCIAKQLASVGMLTQPCPYRADKAQLCLKQPTGDNWFAVMELDLSVCIPPADGYAYLVKQATTLANFITRAIRSEQPSNMFGESWSCTDLGTLLRAAAGELQSIVAVLAPPRTSAKGRRLFWRVISPHKLFDHIIPGFEERCESNVAISFDDASGAELRHRLNKFAVEHATFANLIRREDGTGENQASQALREGWRQTAIDLRRGYYSRAADAKLRRLLSEVDGNARSAAAASEVVRKREFCTRTRTRLEQSYDLNQMFSNAICSSDHLVGRVPFGTLPTRGTI